MSDDWSQLKLGDLVRVTAWPHEFDKDQLHWDTIELYRWLVATGAPLRVVHFDALGIPYGEIRIADQPGERWETVGLNHSCVEMVDA